MLKQMLTTIKGNGLITRGDAVLVALSGGPDSVALLEGLLRLRKRLSFSVCAAHLNHKLRGRESDEDERFVRKLAEERGVPLITGARQVRRIQKKRGGSIEEVAREVRYAFLRNAARGCRANKIALGHNLDDNVETFLMNLVRGSGLSGLSGIPLSRKEGKFVIIRPLLGITRSEVLAFLNKEKLAYRVDRSNLDTALTRNRIRHQLVPHLEREYNPQIKRILMETAHRLREAEECLSAAVAELEEECLDVRPARIAVNIDALRAHSAVLGQEFLRRVFGEQLGVSGERQKLEQVWRLVTGARKEGVGLGKGLVACREYDQLLFVELARVKAHPLEKRLRIPSDVFLAEFGVQVSAELVDRKDFRIRRGRRARFGEAWRKVQQGHAQRFEEFFDGGAIREDSLLIRNRREGDAFQPLGMRGSRKIKQLLIDEKVPLTLRDKIPIFESAGEIVWVVGYRPGAKFAVRASSERVLHLRVKVLYCPE